MGNFGNENFINDENQAVICEGKDLLSQGVSDTSEELKRQADLNARFLDELAKRRFNRTPLILALWGLLLTFAFGLGIAFAIPAMIIGIKRYKKAPTKSLRWAIVISALTICLCVIFIACLSYAITVGVIEFLNQPPPTVE